MPFCRKGPGVLLALALATLAPTRAAAGEAGIDLSGLVGAGYDSNYALLGTARNVPLPSGFSGDASSGLWTLEAGAVGWIEPVGVLELTLEPDFRLVHFFDNEYLVEPGASVSLYVRPAPVVEIGAGGGYRYYSFSVFDENRFHEPRAWFELALLPGNHEISLTYEFAWRAMPDLDDGHESEHSAGLAWSVDVNEFVELGLGIEYDHVSGTESWMRLDALRGQVRMQVQWKVLDFGASYVPGMLWFGPRSMGMLHRAAAWVGVTAPAWMRYGLEYAYENLSEVDRLAPEIPYERHFLLFSVSLAWGFTTREDAPEAGGREGIEVVDGGAVFTVHAPHASCVALVGSLDGWEQPGYEFDGPERDGTWTLEMELPPGRYEVIYVIDGESVTPPGAPGYSEDGFGGRNAVVVVP